MSQRVRPRWPRSRLRSRRERDGCQVMLLGARQRSRREVRRGGGGRRHARGHGESFARDETGSRRLPAFCCREEGWRRRGEVNRRRGLEEVEVNRQRRGQLAEARSAGRGEVRRGHARAEGTWEKPRRPHVPLHRAREPTSRCCMRISRARRCGGRRVRTRRDGDSPGGRDGVRQPEGRLHHPVSPPRHERV